MRNSDQENVGGDDADPTDDTEADVLVQGLDGEVLHFCYLILINYNYFKIYF